MDIQQSASYYTAIQQMTGVKSKMGRWLAQCLKRVLVPSFAVRARTLHFQNTIQATEKRLDRQEGTHPDAVWHLLRANKDGKENAPKEEVILHMALLLMAGSETPSILLAAWIYLMVTHPEVQERVNEEMRHTFQHISDVTLETVSQLQFLNATIDETMRLFPPAGNVPAREIPQDGITIDGVSLPRGTEVNLANWALNRSAQYFRDPNCFRPERWLPDAPATYRHDRLEASKPFTIGPRVCTGIPLALFETRLAMVRLLWEFKILPPSDPAHVNANKAWTLCPTQSTIRAYQSLKKPDIWVTLESRMAN
jgi:cytochrome P450